MCCILQLVYSARFRIQRPVHKSRAQGELRHAAAQVRHRLRHRALVPHHEPGLPRHLQRRGAHHHARGVGPAQPAVGTRRTAPGRAGRRHHPRPHHRHPASRRHGRQRIGAPRDRSYRSSRRARLAHGRRKGAANPVDPRRRGPLASRHPLHLQEGHTGHYRDPAQATGQPRRHRRGRQAVAPAPRSGHPGFRQARRGAPWRRGWAPGRHDRGCRTGTGSAPAA